MIPQIDFIKAVEFASKVMAKGDVRYYLNGVLLRFTEGRIKVAATDGHRMHFCHVLCDHGLEGDYIIDRDSVIQLIRFFSIKPKRGRSVEEMTLIPKEKTLLAECGDRSLHLGVMEGKYPDIDKVFKSDDPVGAPEIGVNAAYISSVSASAKIIGTPVVQGLIMQTWDACSSIQFKVPTSSDFPSIESPAWIVVMPMRM